MPAVLTDTFLCDPHVPGSWRGVLEALREFVEHEAEARAQPQGPSAAQSEALRKLHERLVAGSVELLEPEALADLSEVDRARLFARAVCLVMRLKQCIVGPAEVLDTAGSRTLGVYEADFYATPQNVLALRQRLVERLKLDAGEWAQIEAAVEEGLADARRMLAVVKAIRDEFGLWPDAPDLRGRIHDFFRAFYPDAPLAPEEVELVVTGTLVFLCIPFEGNELTTARFRNLPADEQTAIRSFLECNRSFTQERFARFPAFGPAGGGGALPPDRLASLAQRSGLAADVVQRELSRLVTILPLAEIDKYVVHDVWGHGWQASMLGFEQMYETMADYADPLALDELAAAGPQGLSFRSCFCGTGADMTLDAEQFHRFVAAELAERLTVALSAALAEMMADVAEFKVLALDPTQADSMPSSSLFKLFPTKLDLTMQDLPFYFSQATKVFRLWAQSEKRRKRTCDELVHAGATPEAAAAAVGEAVRLWQELAEGLFAPRLACHAEPDGRLRVNAFTRVALNFLGIHRAILDAYRHLDELPRDGLPLKSYRDLLILGAAAFFEADRSRNLWRVDEYLSLVFMPLCRKLGLGS